jgi:uncharacterized protein (TIGR00255 family)
VDVRIGVQEEAASGGGVSMNKEMLGSYLRAFREAAAEYKIEGQPNLDAAFRLPGMLGPIADRADLPEGAEALILDALTEALHQMNSFREREGAELAAEMRKHAAQISGAVREMEDIRTAVPALFLKRLAERLKELLHGAPVEPQRLAQEVAILADRSDIGEELARLEIHSGQLVGLLDGGGEIGKKLDFLLQEMNREANTILSKTGGAGEGALRITELALGAKAAIEKIREQSLNLE